MAVFEAKNRIRWEPGEEVLPIRSAARGSKAVGLFLVFFGLVWDGFLTASIVAGTRQDGFHPWLVLVMGVMSLGGFAFVGFGLLQLRSLREIFIDGESVQVKERGVSGSGSGWNLLPPTGGCS